MRLGLLSAPPALRVSECARYMGVSPMWIYQAITDGVPVRGRRVKLAAETITSTARHTYRIYEDQFTEFLRAYGWTRIPGSTVSPPPVAVPKRKRP